MKRLAGIVTVVAVQVATFGACSGEEAVIPTTDAAAAVDGPSADAADAATPGPRFCEKQAAAGGRPIVLCSDFDTPGVPAAQGWSTPVGTLKIVPASGGTKVAEVTSAPNVLSCETNEGAGPLEATLGDTIAGEKLTELEVSFAFRLVSRASLDRDLTLFSLGGTNGDATLAFLLVGYVGQKLQLIEMSSPDGTAFTTLQTRDLQAVSSPDVWRRVNLRFSRTGGALAVVGVDEQASESVVLNQAWGGKQFTIGVGAVVETSATANGATVVELDNVIVRATR